MESLLDQGPDEQPFEPLGFAHKALPDKQSCYRVYSSDTEFVEVDADSAYEAMAKSGLRNPIRIQRYSLRRLSVLQDGMLQGDENTNYTPKPELLDAPVNAAAPEPSAPDNAQGTPTEDSLSQADVEKLLNNN
jgi:hypothetical protein